MSEIQAEDVEKTLQFRLLLERRTKEIMEDRDKWRSMCEKMAEALKKIADNPECDGTAEYWEWGNYDDTYRYGVSRGRSIQAELAKEARASYEAMRKEGLSDEAKADEKKFWKGDQNQ